MLVEGFIYQRHPSNLAVMSGIEIKQASVDAEMILQLQMRAYLREAETYNDYSILPLIQHVIY